MVSVEDLTYTSVLDNERDSRQLRKLEGGLDILWLLDVYLRRNITSDARLGCRDSGTYKSRRNASLVAHSGARERCRVRGVGEVKETVCRLGLALLPLGQHVGAGLRDAQN